MKKGIWIWKENVKTEIDYQILNHSFDCFYIDFRDDYNFLDDFVRNIKGDIYPVISCEYSNLLDDNHRHEIYVKARKALLVPGIAGIVLDYIRLKKWTLKSSIEVSELVRVMEQ